MPIPNSAFASARIGSASLTSALEKVREYLISFGVPWVWVIDPLSLTGQISRTRGGVTSVDNRIFFTDRFEVDLTSVPGLD